MLSWAQNQIIAGHWDVSLTSDVATLLHTDKDLSSRSCAGVASLSAM